MTQPPRRMRPRVTQPERQFENWLAAQPTVRLICRMNGHWWPGYELGGHTRVGAVAPPAPGSTRPGAYLLTLSCQREHDGESCGVTRRAYFNNDWTPAVNIYNYPNDPPYMTPPGVYINKARRGRVRLELDIRAEEG